MQNAGVAASKNGKKPCAWVSAACLKRASTATVRKSKTSPHTMQWRLYWAGNLPEPPRLVHPGNCTSHPQKRHGSPGSRRILDRKPRPRRRKITISSTWTASAFITPCRTIQPHLPPLERDASFTPSFTYPDGRRVETIDERNGYDSEIKKCPTWGSPSAP